jgi:hypothetical protein
MDLFKKKLLKISLITTPLSIFFFLFIYTIQVYVAGGIANAGGFPFLVYYDYWFSPGVELYNPLIILVDILLIYLVLTIIGLINYLIKEKEKQLKRKCKIVISIMILFILVLTAINFFIFPFPDLSNLPEPGEYVSASSVKFLQSENTLTVSEVSRSNIKWNDTTIVVNGNALMWNGNLNTWNYGNIELIHSILSDSNIDDIDILDYIANCSGIVTVTYNPTQVTFDTWEFE